MYFILAIYMCGIFCILNNSDTPEYVSGNDETIRTAMSSQTRIDEHIIQCSFKKGQGRGPEMSKLLNVDENVTLGFHRLAINGIDEVSNQPIELDGVYLICNGEIYNYKELYQLIPGCIPKTNSDCEVILHLYIRYGIEQTLNMLDGVFAFVILDKRTQNNTDTDTSTKRNRLIIARDPYGVRPMYMLSPKYLSKKSQDRALNTPHSEILSPVSKVEHA